MNKVKITFIAGLALMTLTACNQPQDKIVSQSASQIAQNQTVGDYQKNMPAKLLAQVGGGLHVGKPVINLNIIKQIKQHLFTDSDYKIIADYMTKNYGYSLEKVSFITVTDKENNAYFGISYRYSPSQANSQISSVLIVSLYQPDFSIKPSRNYIEEVKKDYTSSYLYVDGAELKRY